MAAHIKCDSCNTNLYGGDECYCETCYNSLGKEIEVLEERVKELEAEIEKLKEELKCVKERD